MAFVLASGMAGVVGMAAPAMVQRSYAQRTLREMSAILQGCLQYDTLHGAWPSSLVMLQDVLPQAVAVNAWGNAFMIAAEADRIWVETDVPSGAADPLMARGFMVIRRVSGKDRVRMSTGRVYGPAARLVYEKRNVYAP